MKLSSPFGCLSGPLQENNWIWSFDGAYRERGKNKSGTTVGDEESERNLLRIGRGKISSYEINAIGMKRRAIINDGIECVYKKLHQIYSKED